MTGLYDDLLLRGFVYQCTDEKAVRNLLDSGHAVFYVGFDPTADSLHAGSLIPILAMMHLQKAGHKPIAVLGSGTAMVGDPSGKTEMRKMLIEDIIRANAVHLRSQLSRFLVLDGNAGIWVDNATWLRDLNYIDFLRDVGRHFSVNKMLAAESYKIRLESGLSFLEFNYMLLQSYDFYVLARDHGCLLQMGGQDQWGNIVAGADLVRRMTGADAHGLTFPLLTDASGNKLGKTVAGAVWLSAEKTAPFDFYQYWRNTEDRDVERFLKLFTFLPVDECVRLGRLEPPALNRAKEILGFEITRIVHGDAAAAQAYLAAAAHYPSADPDGKIETSSTIRSPAAGRTDSATSADLPEAIVPRDKAAAGIRVAELIVLAGFAPSNGEAKRLIQQGGIRLGETPITDVGASASADTLAASPILRAGKKRMVRLVVR